MLEALEGEFKAVQLDLSIIYVGRPESRQASVTNRPINPLEPITKIGLVSNIFGEEPFMFVGFILFAFILSIQMLRKKKEKGKESIKKARQSSINEE